MCLHLLYGTGILQTYIIMYFKANNTVLHCTSTTAITVVLLLLPLLHIAPLLPPTTTSTTTTTSSNYIDKGKNKVIIQ